MARPKGSKNKKEEVEEIDAAIVDVPVILVDSDEAPDLIARRLNRLNKYATT